MTREVGKLGFTLLNSTIFSSKKNYPTVQCLAIFVNDLTIIPCVKKGKGSIILFSPCVTVSQGFNVFLHVGLLKICGARDRTVYVEL